MVARRKSLGKRSNSNSTSASASWPAMLAELRRLLRLPLLETFRDLGVEEHVGDLGGAGGRRPRALPAHWAHRGPVASPRAGARCVFHAGWGSAPISAPEGNAMPGAVYCDLCASWGADAAACVALLPWRFLCMACDKGAICAADVAAHANHPRTLGCFAVAACALAACGVRADEAAWACADGAALQDACTQPRGLLLR